MCGEKCCPAPADIFSRGSPPRVRGKVTSFNRFCCPYGITPACAGKRQRKKLSRYFSWDHPRVCGEKRRHALDYPRRHGSPPRVRGKASAPGFTTRLPRITPACAGKRKHLCCPPSNCGDHPRVCGEKDWPYAMPLYHGGSPPRVRGKDQVKPGDKRAVLITPACAGKRYKFRDSKGNI